jgi:hypothetical protein
MFKGSRQNLSGLTELDIHIRVAYNFSMVAFLELKGSPAINRCRGMGRIARFFFHPVFWFPGSFLSTSNKGVKTLTPTVPISIR